MKPRRNRASCALKKGGQREKNLIFDFFFAKKNQKSNFSLSGGSFSLSSFPKRELLINYFTNKLLIT
jgi:hypothetical protein